jgi:hypothetical protein
MLGEGLKRSKKPGLAGQSFHHVILKILIQTIIIWNGESGIDEPGSIEE